MQRSIFHAFKHLLQWHRTQKIAIAICVDLILISFSFIGAFFIRLEDVSLLSEARYAFVLLVLSIVCIAAFFKMGLYHTLLRFISMHGFMIIAVGAGIGGSVIAILGYFSTLLIPRTIPIIFTLLFFVMAAGIRFAMRYLYAYLSSHEADQVILFGSKSACNQLVSSLSLSEKYRVCGIFNEDVEKGTILRGIRVYPITLIDTFIEHYQPTCLVLAHHDIQETQRELLLSLMEKYPLQLRRIASIDEAENHQTLFQNSEIITLETLMDRSPVAGFEEQMHAHLAGRCILVTGAGGSIGSEICKQAMQCKPRVLVLFEISEFALFEIQRKVESMHSDVRLIPVLGNIQQYEALATVLEQYQVDIVYHAAAYKHVALVEQNPLQAVENNVLGTWNVVRASIEKNVKQCVLISSDKAVRPTSFMGATKRIAELIVQYYALENTKTRFNSVRFGNVMGSSGSVIPLFQQQIQQGGPVTVTHPDVERFFMTIAEASHLVIQASALSTDNGEVFVLDMGKPVRILDLAKKLIRFSGHTLHSASNPKGDIKIIFTGLKVGEKINEELFITSRVLKTAHPKISCTLEQHMESTHLLEWLYVLSEACKRRDVDAILASIQAHAIDIAYDPDINKLSVSDPKRITKAVS